MPPLIEEDVLEEGMAIGGEEGPSEVVSMNPPVAHEGIKRVKQERIEEGQVAEIRPLSTRQRQLQGTHLQ